MKRPAFQFYPADWRKDVELRSCSIAARGLWIDLLCLAHECDPYGHLIVNGRPMTAAQMAGQVGLPAAQFAKLLQELIDNGVARKTPEGVVYSKRMVEDEDLRQRRAEGGKAGSEHGVKGAEHGSKGGRPKTPRGVSEPPLEPPPSSSSSSSPSGKEISSPSDSPSVEPNGPKPTVPCPYREIVAAYHEALPTLPKVRIFDGKGWEARCRAMRELWGWVLSSRRGDGSRRAENAEQAMAWLRDYFAKATENDFVMGRARPGNGHETWRCDIDYLLSAKGLKQVLEKTVEAA